MPWRFAMKQLSQSNILLLRHQCVLQSTWFTSVTTRHEIYSLDILTQPSQQKLSIAGGRALNSILRNAQ